MRSRLGYLHMPKAAGTSIRAAFASYYDESDTVPYSFDRHLFGDDPRIDEVREPVFLGEPEQLRGFRYMEGHWALPTMAAAFAPADIVCVLREPRARFLSHYTFWRGWPDSMHELWEPYNAAKFAQLALGDYCREPAIAHQADNLVTRLLLGPHPLVPNDGHIHADVVDTVADEACRRLDELGYVDILERGDDVYRDLEAWFGSPLTRERLNETDLAFGRPVDVADLTDATTLALVDGRNACDLRIWMHVAERRGLAADSARSLADSTFSAAVAKVVAAHSQPVAPDPTARHPLDRAPSEPPIVSVSERPSTPVRLVRLVRRGPGAIRDRIVAGARRRKSTATPDA